MPLTQPTARMGYSYGAFYDMLVERFPEHRTVQNVFDVQRLCDDLGVTHETVYKMLRSDLMHPRQAAKLISVHGIEVKRLRKSPEDRKRRKEGGAPIIALTKHDLAEYVIPDPE